MKAGDNKYAGIFTPEHASYATQRQLEVMEAFEKAGDNIDAAATALGVHRKSVTDALDAVVRKAALMGHSPVQDSKGIAEAPYVVRGKSTLFDADGKVRAQWVKTQIDEAKREALARATIEALSREVKGLSPKVKAPRTTHDDLLCVVPMGDPHFGMYAWARETGSDFDTEIARKLTLGAVDRLMETAPDAGTCIILPLGDVFHANDQSNVTPGHKNQLDVDTRFVQVLQIGIETYRHAVLRALQKHAKVIVRFVQGNHDPQAIWALAFSISAYFSNEPRVTVDLSPSKFWFHRFGRVLIGSTHGDTVKPESLEGIMASDRAQDWGATAHRYWYTGHIHSSNKKEFRGCTWESFRTLAAQDAWAAGHGYRAGRDMLAIIHHHEHGEVERHRVDVGMLA